MNKPISLIIHDTKEDIVNVINNSALPASVLLLILRDILSEMDTIDRQLYAQDLQAYQDELKKMEEKNDNTEDKS